MAGLPWCAWEELGEEVAGSERSWRARRGGAPDSGEEGRRSRGGGAKVGDGGAKVGDGGAEVGGGDAKVGDGGAEVGGGGAEVGGGGDGEP